MKHEQLIRELMAQVNRDVVRPLLEANRKVVTEAAMHLQFIASTHCVSCDKAEMAQSALAKMGELSSEAARSMQKPII